MPIEHSASGEAVAITGNAINFFQVACLRSAISLYLETGIKPTRGVGPKQMCALATRYTGTSYKSGRRGLEQALTDIRGILHRDPDSCVRDGAQ